jgi:hypothetical protein
MMDAVGFTRNSLSTRVIGTNDSKIGSANENLRRRDRHLSPMFTGHFGDSGIYAGDARFRRVLQKCRVVNLDLTREV